MLILSSKHMYLSDYQCPVDNLNPQAHDWTLGESFHPRFISMSTHFELHSHHHHFKICHQHCHSLLEWCSKWYLLTPTESTGHSSDSSRLQPAYLSLGYTCRASPSCSSLRLSKPFVALVAAIFESWSCGRPSWSWCCSFDSSVSYEPIL